MLDTDDLDAFGDLTEGFAARVRDVLFDPRSGESPDGDLASVPGLLSEAGALGLLADPNADDDWGVWGRNTIDDGCLVSMNALATLGAACAGFAGAVHAHGIGRLALTLGRDVQPGRHQSPTVGSKSSVAAAFVPAYGVALDPRTHSDAVQIHRGSGPRSTTDARLGGTSPYVWSAGEPDLVSVAARCDNQWMIVVVPTDRDGVTLKGACRRVGIRATDQFAVGFDDVEFDDDEVVAAGTQAERILARITACDWLGSAALSLGAARAALEQGTIYSTSRRQGGTAIADHAAVRLLLANAAHQIGCLEAILCRHARVPLEDLDTSQLVRWAISARLGIAAHAAVAVTDALQTHGGYGYMDDYGLSKRLRDVHAVAARHGSREQLLLLYHDLTGAHLPLQAAG